MFSPSGSSSHQLNDVERLRLALNLEEQQPSPVALEPTLSPSQRPNPFSPSRSTPAAAPAMPSFAVYQPLTNIKQTSQASSALTSLSSSSSSGALDMDVVEEPAAVGTVKQKPSRRGGKGPNPFSRSESPAKPPSSGYTLISTNQHGSSSEGVGGEGSQRSYSVAASSVEGEVVVIRPVRSWGLSLSTEELVRESTSVEPRPLKRARSGSFRSQQFKQERRSISPRSWDRSGFDFLGALDSEDAMREELDLEEQEQHEYRSSTSSLSPPPPSPVPSTQESLLTPNRSPFQPPRSKIDRPAARTRSRTVDDSPQKPPPQTQTQDEEQEQDQHREQQSSPRSVAWFRGMEETQEREEEFDELDTSEDEEDGDDPMGLRAAEVLIVREAEGEQEHEEQEMVCFVDLPRQVESMSPCQASSDLEERAVSRTRSPESVPASTDELLSSGPEDGRDDSPAAMEEEACLPSLSQAQLKIGNLERQLALERERNQSLVDDVAVGLKENANVLRLAEEIKQQAQTLTRSSRRKDVEVESLKKEITDLRNQLGVEKGRVKDLTADVICLTAEKTSLQTLTTSQSTSLLDFQLQLFTAQQALLDPNSPHPGPEIIPRPAFIDMVPALASMPAKKKAQKVNELLKQQVFELTTKNWAMQTRLEKLQEAELAVEVETLESRLLQKMPEKRETRERRELEAATLKIKQLEQCNAQLQAEGSVTKANLEKLKSHAAELQRSSNEVAGLLESL
ncbi:hypothetical protein BDY24DRAFT_387018 [Mrakia frigida]|uniref:uncharacterized protein n=1 Tax=Mrakia frigida TaxID=29902 RepID=UPI003FCBFCAC